MRNFRSLKRPTNALPQVVVLLDEMNRQRIGVRDMADRTGIAFRTIERWFWMRANPSVANLEACFNVLGRTLTPRVADSESDDYWRGYKAGYMAGQRSRGRARASIVGPPPDACPSSDEGDSLSKSCR